MTTLVRADVLLACCRRTLTLRVPCERLEQGGVTMNCGALTTALRLHARYCPSA